MKMRWITDIEADRQLCLHCRKLHPLTVRVCDRCGEPVHQRIPHSIPVTWSLTVAAIIFLVPANLLPMMIVKSIAGEDAGTIMDGVIYFLEHGEAGIGIVIFTASIFVPFFKLTVLFYLLLIVHFGWRRRALFGLKLYRIIHFIGKWSMLDIFVVALMVGIVQFKNLATIVTGPAAIAFMLAVLMTMFATEHFDPRLMFDKEISKKPETKQHEGIDHG
ncbi:paraquat-inducible protein A [Hydrogenimonas urashimensis]|uniref:paraquat-inducible protein A n=1 Tax=Hydrogenimonas urashimensis TaxID=2740515 RepID=UPI0019160243|nr:paraquat-inducible protein A [Hydrogenimonas urashimensis]